MKSVQLMLSPSGEVEAVVDELGKKLQYEVTINENGQRKEVPEHILMSCGAKMTPPVEKALAPFFDDMLAAVVFPTTHVPKGMSHPTGALYVLEMGKKPRTDSFWPMNLQYATGLSMVEIEPRLDDEGLVLTKEYLSSSKMKSIIPALSESLRVPADPDLQPGVLLGEGLKHLEEFTSSAYKNDPLLRMYRSDWESVWRPHLAPDDYLALVYSDWADVCKATKDTSGHADGTKHWYLLVRHSLPLEMADQLMLTRFVNPEGDTWERLAGRKVFARALEISTLCRERVLDYSLEKLGLKRKKSNPQSTVTTTNVFDTTKVTIRSDGSTKFGVTYYAGCAPTHRANRGVLMERGPMPEEGFLWLHGPPSNTPGGMSWKQAANCSASPVLFRDTEARVGKSTLKALAEAGWDQASGFAKLDVFTLM